MNSSGPILAEPAAFYQIASMVHPKTGAQVILVHIPSKVLQFSYPPALLIVALGALILIVLRVRYRSLWPGILFHSLWNGGGFLLLLWH